jgi:5-methyltetrahydrofolate--homocysteine methyltransferase
MKEVIIDVEKPVVMIGEKINPTGHKKLGEALKYSDFEYIKTLVHKQLKTGAHILDINVGAPGIDETVMLPEIVKVVSDEAEVPFCLDSNNPKALESALKVTPGKPIINSVNGEEEKLTSILPLVKEYGTAVIALTMDDNGIPADAQARLKVADKIINRAESIGIQRKDIIVDPLVLTVGSDYKASLVTLETIKLVRDNFGVNINLGASNVSFGLPDRQIINQAFLALAIGVGAGCVITDTIKLSQTIVACDLLLGKDMYGKEYLKHSRKMKAV